MYKCYCTELNNLLLPESDSSTVKQCYDIITCHIGDPNILYLILLISMATLQHKGTNQPAISPFPSRFPRFGLLIHKCGSPKLRPNSQPAISVCRKHASTMLSPLLPPNSLRKSAILSSNGQRKTLMTPLRNS